MGTGRYAGRPSAQPRGYVFRSSAQGGLVNIKYATSILDYVFRELAVSYMSRYDLAHVDPTESNFDALGKGVEEGKSPDEGHTATKYLSKGITRSRGDNLVVMRGGGGNSVAATTSDAPAGGARVTSIASGGAIARHGDVAEGATALKTAEPERELSPTEKLEAQAWSKSGSAAASTAVAPSKAERRAEAKAKGYEGDMCGECSNFTLVRNGTCMKCDTCGSTTGCS